MALHLAAGETLVLPMFLPAVMSFWFRSTTTSFNHSPEVLSCHSSSASKGGFGIGLGSNGALFLYAKNGGGSIDLNLSGSKVVNDGNLHHVLYSLGTSFNEQSPNHNSVWVDGVLDMDGDNSNAWGGDLTALIFGTSNDGYWDQTVADFAEITTFGIWSSFPRPTIDHAKSIADGFNALSVFGRLPPSSYLPLIHDDRDLIEKYSIAPDGSGRTAPILTGGTFISDHPRIFPL